MAGYGRCADRQDSCMRAIGFASAPGSSGSRSETWLVVGLAASADSMWCSRVLAFGFLASVAMLAPARADPFGRFLFTADTKGSVVYSWGLDTPTQFDQQVTCGDVVCGDIKFDYETYLRKPGGTVQGGAALVGGFYLAPGLRLAAGDRLAWVQTVSASLTGTNGWGIDPSKGPFNIPDAGMNSPNSPVYPRESLPVAPTNPPGPPTLAFQDFPARLFARGAQFWLGELGLVCIDGMVNGVTQAFVIDTFEWGFEVQSNPNMIFSIGPQNFGAPSTSYLSTLNAYYSGRAPDPPTLGAKTVKYNFQAGCDDCFVAAAPEPSSILLLGTAVLGVFGLTRFRPKERTT